MIRILFDILRLRAGPQDLPAAPGLAFLLTAAYFGQALYTDRLLDGAEASPRSLVAIGFQLAAAAVLLNVRGFRERLPQTISALAGTGFLLGIVSLFMLLQLDRDTPQPGLALAYLGLFLWSLAVDGHIYHHALSIKISLGMLVAVLVFTANFMLLGALFG